MYVHILFRSKVERTLVSPPNCPSIVDFCTEESHVCTYMAEDGAFYTCFILDERHIA